MWGQFKEESGESVGRGTEKLKGKVNITCSSRRALVNQDHSTRVVAAYLLRTRYCLSASGVNQFLKRGAVISIFVEGIWRREFQAKETASAEP